MRIKHHPGRAIEASLSLEQNSAMGALYEANWDKVQSSMNSLIESHHVLPGTREDTGKLTPFRELDEDDEGLPDEDEDDAQALKRSSTVLKALNGYRPSTIRRIRNRQFPEWDELKEPSYSEENLDTIRPHSSRKPFANTHRPLPPIAVPGHNGYRLQHQLPQHPPASKEYRMYANIASSESFRGPSPGAPKGVALKRSNTVAVQPGGSTDMYRPRTLDRRDVFQRLKEKVRQQKPIDEFSDHQRSYGFPANAAPTKTNSRYKPSAAPYCDSKNSKSLESISTFPDFRRGSDDSESNLSIGDRMTGYRSSSDLCSQIYREDDKSFRNIPKATATLSRNKSVKGRPILDDIPADLLPRSTDSDRSKKNKKVGFGKMLYNTISAGTKFPRALLKNHFNKDSSETSEYDSFSYRDSEPPSPYQSQSSPSSSKSNSSASSSSSFKKLFRSRSRSNRRQQGSSSSSDSADSFLVPTPEERPVPPPLPAPRIPTSGSSVAAAAAAVHQNIVPGVHTYARKRRTGNLNAEPIYGNLEELYDNENEANPQIRKVQRSVRFNAPKVIDTSVIAARFWFCKNILRATMIPNSKPLNVSFSRRSTPLPRWKSEIYSLGLNSLMSYWSRVTFIEVACRRRFISVVLFWFGPVLALVSLHESDCARHEYGKFT
ncbi:hypothetical protein pipiens_006183 [Culex pipiens pipiens]|uniref:Uncharacterized protein n=1 Tax=Culex pipiens pipiens TaxID=38569 RepID=A0ABD1DR37_CULPP